MGAKITTNGSEPVVLAGGLAYVESRAQLVLDPGLADGSTVRMELTYDRELGRVVASELHVTRAREGRELTSKNLREIAIQNAVVKVVMNWMLHVIGEDSMTATAADALDNFNPAKGRAKPEVLRDAAVIYTIARVGSWPPLKTVAETLGVSQSTATRLVADARKVGLLTDG